MSLCYVISFILQIALSRSLFAVLIHSSLAALCISLYEIYIDINTTFKQSQPPSKHGVDKMLLHFWLGSFSGATWLAQKKRCSEPAYSFKVPTLTVLGQTKAFPLFYVFHLYYNTATNTYQCSLASTSLLPKIHRRSLK